MYMATVLSMSKSRAMRNRISVAVSSKSVLLKSGFLDDTDDDKEEDDVVLVFVSVSMFSLVAVVVVVVVVSILDDCSFC